MSAAPSRISGAVIPPLPNPHKPVRRRISRSEVAKLSYFLAIILGTTVIFFATHTLLPSTLLSILAYFLFAPMVDAMERKGIHRTFAIMGIFLVSGCAVAIIIQSVVPRVYREAAAFEKDKDRYAQSITERFEKQENRLFGDSPLLNDLQLTQKAFDWLEKSSKKVWDVIPDVASQLFVILVLFPVLTFALLKEAPTLRRELLQLVPNRYFENFYSLSSRVLDQMGGYVSARILESFLITVLVTVGCIAFRVPYAVLLGLFAGATNPIPYLGPILGAVPGLALTILEPQFHNQVVYVAAVYLAANLIDMLVIFPVVIAKIVDLHPVAVLISVMLGSQLFGIAGMVLAVPVTSILKIFLQEIYTKVYQAF